MHYLSDCSSLDAKLLQGKIKVLKEKNNTFCKKLKLRNNCYQINKANELEKIKYSILDEKEISTVEYCHKKALELMDYRLRLKREKKRQNFKSNIFHSTKNGSWLEPLNIASSQNNIDIEFTTKVTNSSRKSLKKKTVLKNATEISPQHSRKDVDVITIPNDVFPASELDDTQKGKEEKNKFGTNSGDHQKSDDFVTNKNKLLQEIYLGTVKKKQSESCKNQRHRSSFSENSLKSSNKLDFNKSLKTNDVSHNSKLFERSDMDSDSDNDVIYLESVTSKNLTTSQTSEDDKVVHKSDVTSKNCVLNCSKNKRKLSSKLNNVINANDVIYLESVTSKNMSTSQTNEDDKVVHKSDVNSKSCVLNCSKNKRKLSSKLNNVIDDNDVIYLESVPSKNTSTSQTNKDDKVVHKSKVKSKNYVINSSKSKRKLFLKLNDVVVIPDEKPKEKEKVSLDGIDQIVLIDDEKHEENPPLNISRSENHIFDLIDETSQNSELDSMGMEDVKNDLVDSLGEPVEEIILPVLDLEEEPVDFPVPTLHASESLEMAKDDIKSLVLKGIVVKSGRWTKEEEELLRRNFKDFQSRFGVEDARLLLGFGRNFPPYKYERSNIRKFLKAKHFYLRLGKDLYKRTLFNIYKKSRKLFNPLNRKFTAKDISLLHQLQKKHGNKWVLIGLKIGLSPEQCEVIYNYYKKPIAKGKWTDDEVQQLISALKIVAKTTDLTNQDLKGIPWEKVSKLVPTRNARQCFQKWRFNRLIKNVQYPKWNKWHSGKLVYLLKKRYIVQEECDINWNDIYYHFKNVTHSSFDLSSKWVRIKSHIAIEFRGNYLKTLHYCYKKYKKYIIQLNLKKAI